MDTFHFQVEPFSEDITGRLSWGIMGNTLLRVAEKSAITHGFGYDAVHKRNTAWVLSRLLVEIPDMPHTGQKYSIDTWVSRIYRQFTDRLFAIRNEDGSPLGYASSVWALIDIENRQPVNLEDLDSPEFHEAVDTAEIPISTFTRSRLRPNGEPQRVIDVMQSDLDINGHLNSIRYLQMAIDSIYNIYKEELDIRANTPRRVEMTYAAETFYGDQLFVYTEQAEQGQYHVVMTRSDGTVVTKSVIFMR